MPQYCFFLWVFSLVEMEAIKSFENILAALDVNCFTGSDSQTVRKSEVTN